MSVYSNNTYDKSSPNDAWFKLATFVRPKSSILDVGCSSGKLGAALKKEKHVKVMGLDVDKDDVALAKKNLDDAQVHNIEADSVDQLGTYDAVIMADVIEHLLNPVAALKKVKSILKPGGRLIFSIPNMANMTTRIELMKGRFEYKDFGLLDRTHLHFYDLVEVNRVFREAGFSVKATDCTVRDVPESILRKEFAAIGIELTPQLTEFLHTSEALTYQFIGYAEPDAKPKKFEPHTTSPLDSVSRELDHLSQQHAAELAQRDDNAKGLEKLASEQRIRADELDQKLNAILTSKGWKALSKFYTIKSRLQK